MDVDPSALRIGDLDAGYESFYAKAHSPTEPLGFWVRYTTLKRPGGATTSSLWFTLFDDSSVAASKITRAVTPAPDASWISIDDASLDGSAIRGSTGDASWDLRVSSNEPPLYHLPKRWMYRARLPRTKPISPRPSASFSGSVTFGDRTVAVEGWPGMLGHNWGTEHAERWIWLHAIDGSSSSSWLDVVLGRIKVGPATTPWVANGAISLEGVRYRLGGLSARGLSVNERPDGASLVLPGKDVQARLEVSAPRARIVGWRYAHPDGSEHHVANCSIADATIAVSGAREETLTITGAVAYELGMRETDHGIPLQPYGEEVS